MDLYPHGWDYGWLATDGVGNVAIFITAGIGPIPSPVLSERELADRAEELVWELPERGEVHLEVNLPRPDDFIGFARRGLFAYDWADVHRTTNKSAVYERYASPVASVRVGDLPPEIALLARRVLFCTLRFADCPTVSVTDQFGLSPS